jgi:hypothetical protein
LRVAVEMRRAPFACAIGTVSVADGRHRRICSRNKVSDRLLSCAISCAIGWVCSDPPQWLTLTLEVLANISNITVRGERYAAGTISPASRAASLPRCQSPPKHAWKLSRGSRNESSVKRILTPCCDRGLSGRKGTKPDRRWSLAGEGHSVGRRTSPPAKVRPRMPHFPLIFPDRTPPTLRQIY